jgi:threonine/homoserine/homoserine lactone efflux protein
MSESLYLGLLGFSVVSGFTPGPNNLIALASGANYGYRKTIPHVLGVTLGFVFMLALMGAGLGGLFTAIPSAYAILRWASLAYLLFLSWKIATSTGLGEQKGNDANGKPMTIIGSALFQWINPKAWVAAVTIVTTFTEPARYWPSLGVCGATNVMVAFSSVSSWALFGTIVKKWLTHPVKQRAFNVAMALLLVASVVPSVLTAR